MARVQPRFSTTPVRWASVLLLTFAVACATTPAGRKPTASPSVPTGTGDEPVAEEPAEPAQDSAYESTADEAQEQDDASASADEAAQEETDEDDGAAVDGEEGSDDEAADGETADEAAADGEVVEDVDEDGGDEEEPTQAQKAPQGALAQRAESAVEGVIIGTVVGGQIAGGYGAAIGAAVFGLYGLVTGDVPFDSGQKQRGPGSGGGDADDALESEIEEELEKQSELEDEIEAELKRQEDLLEQIDKQEELNKEIEKETRTVDVTESDPLAAPTAPYVREIPDSIFDVAEREIDGVDKVVKTLDADRDGRAEMEKTFDDKTGALESVSQDTNYDGLLDSQYSYGPKGEILTSIEDTDHDGVPDRWVKFVSGRGTEVEVDRNNDGTRDGFIAYQNDTLAYEQFDDDNNGKIDRRVEYANRTRSVEMEDANADGTMDLWTYYEPGGRPTRIEKDTRGADGKSGSDGKPDIIEYYAGTAPGSMVIERKEEDTDGDGQVDVVAYYENGKLARKEILKAKSAAKKQ
jgi:hypothetical protein